MNVVIISKNPNLARSLADKIEAIPDVSLFSNVSSFATVIGHADRSFFDVVLIDIELCNSQAFELTTVILDNQNIRWLTFEHENSKTNDISYIIQRRSGLFPISESTSPEVLGSILKSLFVAQNSNPRLSTRAYPIQQTNYTKTVVIGGSTGGIDALSIILEAYPEKCPPTVIVQHTGQAYLPSLAKLLAKKCKAKVSLASGETILTSGNVVLATGCKKNTIVSKEDGRQICKFAPAITEQLHTPSIDALFTSASHLGIECIGVLLTGMGQDGSVALGKMKKRGATTIVQDELTSVVYGMPKVAWENGSADFKLPIQEIGAKILSLASS